MVAEKRGVVEKRGVATYNRRKFPALEIGPQRVRNSSRPILVLLCPLLKRDWLTLHVSDNPSLFGTALPHSD